MGSVLSKDVVIRELESKCPNTFNEQQVLDFITKHEECYYAMLSGSYKKKDFDAFYERVKEEIGEEFDGDIKIGLETILVDQQNNRDINVKKTMFEKGTDDPTEAVLDNGEEELQPNLDGTKHRFDAISKEEFLQELDKTKEEFQQKLDETHRMIKEDTEQRLDETQRRNNTVLANRATMEDFRRHDQAIKHCASQMQLDELKAELANMATREDIMAQEQLIQKCATKTELGELREEHNLDKEDTKKNVLEMASMVDSLKFSAANDRKKYLHLQQEVGEIKAYMVQIGTDAIVQQQQNKQMIKELQTGNHHLLQLVTQQDEKNNRMFNQQDGRLNQMLNHLTTMSQRPENNDEMVISQSPVQDSFMTGNINGNYNWRVNTNNNRLP